MIEEIEDCPVQISLGLTSASYQELPCEFNEFVGQPCLFSKSVIYCNTGPWACLLDGISCLGRTIRTEAICTLPHDLEPHGGSCMPSRGIGLLPLFGFQRLIYLQLQASFALVDAHCHALSEKHEARRIWRSSD